MDGEVIGINVAIRANAQKIGFAIPIDDARKIIAKMMSVEHLDNTFHGTITKDIKSGATRMLVVDGAHPDSPAAIAGLRSGDVITKVGNLDVIDGVDLERALLHRAPGDRVEITVKRSDKLEKTMLSLAGYPGGRSNVANDLQITARANNDDSDRFWSQLGLRMTLLDKWETMSVDNIVWIMNQITTQAPGADGQNQVKFYLVRGQETRYGHLPISSAPRTASNGN